MAGIYWTTPKDVGHGIRIQISGLPGLEFSLTGPYCVGHLVYVVHGRVRFYRGAKKVQVYESDVGANQEPRQ